MGTKNETRAILEQALIYEKDAEENCGKLLTEFKLNGFAELVEHIKNDEIHHQDIVKKLIGFLSEEA
ncbi:hypothetical protein KJ781_04230 [Patescibacteria group bacterium]|nr:hypothetical protein [Patescibacteria group bacterium]MBU1448801.1 hypothetical protein [Patescibacteria group bacterium]MBU2613603.1 hypothetical protein [Patescibacteria group bacterium]